MKKVIIIFVLLVFVTFCVSLKHDLTITDDSRAKFFIENFGFEEGGKIHMQILNFKVGNTFLSEDNQDKVGFMILTSKTDSNSFVEESPAESNIQTCMHSIASVIHVFPNVYGEPVDYFYTILPHMEGFYNIYFRNCLGQPVSFELKLENYNIGPDGKINYLSSGYSSLPTIYGVFTVIYFICLIIWIFGFLRGKGSNVNRIHYLMTLLIVLKMLSLLFKTIEYHEIKVSGSAKGWNIVYYIFAVLKGTMFFILIALIGTGWRFIKPFLSDKDKRIFLIVIPLQILDNAAMIVIEETAPGSQGWLTWKDIFRLVDIICCGAILIPIIWSIKHLREASQSDGKAILNIQKLTLFRQFYLMVVSYIYFTRIIVYLVDATLPFRLVSLGEIFTETATLLFFCLTGYKFRPSPDNPYFKIPTEEEEEEGEKNIELGQKKEENE